MRLVNSSSMNVSTYQLGTGRLVASRLVGGTSDNPEEPVSCAQSSSDSTKRVYRYDQAGNLGFMTADWWQRKETLCPQSLIYLDALVRNARYYDAESRLRVADNRSLRNGPDRIGSDPPGFEEYRYDALGRRILRRARNTPNETRDLVQRFVWDGNQLVAEIQYPGGSSRTNSELEQDTTTLTSNGDYFGRVLYLHGEGIDQALSITRIGYGKPIAGTYTAWDPIAFVPHWDFQGRGYESVTYGATAKCKTVGSTAGCFGPYWPARLGYGISISVSEWPQYFYGGWYGSLAQDQLDGTGQLYRRNRYYDPATGRFTQEDPIGLAGGLNLYGYANGDPVNFSDPFGLCPVPQVCLAALGAGAGVVLNGAMNMAMDRPFLENWQRAAIGGAIAGATAGLAAGPEAAAAFLTRGTATAIGAGPAVAATAHGAQRMADRSRLGAEGVRDAVANATRQLVQSDGANVFVRQVNGRFNVVVQGERGVITTFKNLSEKSLDRLAKNYGWEPR